jgi:hypothetical protein
MMENKSDSMLLKFAESKAPVENRQPVLKMPIEYLIGHEFKKLD